MYIYLHTSIHTYMHTFNQPCTYIHTYIPTFIHSFMDMESIHCCNFFWPSQTTYVTTNTRTLICMFLHNTEDTQPRRDMSQGSTTLGTAEIPRTKLIKWVTSLVILLLQSLVSLASDSPLSCFSKAFPVLLLLFVLICSFHLFYQYCLLCCTSVLLFFFSFFLGCVLLVLFYWDLMHSYPSSAFLSFVKTEYWN